MSEQDETVKPPVIPLEYRDTRKIGWWGCTYTVTPAVADGHLGDGRILLGFQCLNTRPNYYLIRVDSSFFANDSDERDAIGEVIEALTDEFSEMELERECLEAALMEQGIEPTGENTDLAGNEDRLGWPVLSLDSGYHWWKEADL